MAQTRKRRRRKYRGTQGGRIDTGRRRGRPRTREEARARAKARGTRKSGGTRFDNPPTWRGAAIRGVVAAALFVVLLLAIFGRPVGESLAFGAFMLAFYIPAGYYIDTLIWRRRERSRLRAKQGD
jgi:hypothetical protein